MRKTYLLVMLHFSLLAMGGTRDHFVLFVNPNIEGTANPNIFVIGTVGGGYNYNVDCDSNGGDDGTAITGDFVCDYSQSPPAETYTLRIKDNSGNGTGFPQFIARVAGYEDNQDKLSFVRQWGDGKWRSMENAFKDAQNLMVYTEDEPDFSQLSSLAGMFMNAPNANPDTSLWDVSTVTDMSNMFSGTGSSYIELGNWDVSAVTNMSGMFRFATFVDPGIRNLDVSSVEDMSYMFAGAQQLAGNLFADWDVSSVTNMAYMFTDTSIDGLDLSHWGVFRVQNMQGMFKDTQLLEADLSNWDVAAVRDFSHMFENSKMDLTVVDNWNVVAAINMASMFKSSAISQADFRQWDVSHVTDMSAMFAFTDMINLSVDTWNVSAVVNMEQMFKQAHRVYVATEEWNVSSVSNMSSMFESMRVFQHQFENWDVSAVTDMSNMFKAVIVSKLDISAWNVANVINMEGMFQAANYVELDIADWNLAALENASAMFRYAGAVNPDVRNWDVSHVTTMASMFANALRATPDISQWDVSSVTDMSNMFNNNALLTKVYDATLKNWSQLPLQTGVVFSAGESTFCFAEDSRAEIISMDAWQLNDNGKECTGTAMHLSETGLGQALIFPYYTVNNNFSTFVNLVNSTDQAKALRVRFREAANGREVFAFNLYLGPEDAWSAALLKISQGAESIPSLFTVDQSCTIPVLTSNSGISFNKDHFTGDFADAFGVEAERMNEGFIEVIEMGVLTGESAVATIIGTTQVAADCQRLSNAWSAQAEDHYWQDDAKIDMLPPSGGLLGNVILIDIEGGNSINQEPTIIANFSDEVIHFNRDNAAPSLANGKTKSLLKKANGQPVVMDWDTGFEAVSSLLMKSAIENEFALDRAIDAKTNWIFTLPTKSYHSDALLTAAPILPFTGMADASHCEEYSINRVFDRESAAQGLVTTEQATPLQQQASSLCYATNTSIFRDAQQQDPGIFQSQFLNDDIPLEVENGWLSMGFEQKSLSFNNEGGFEITGLPVIGFSIQKYINANAEPDILAAYTGIFAHKNTVVVNEFNTSNIVSVKGGLIDADMHLGTDNQGQVLLYPYYTVKNGLNTLISVVNSSDQVKALKVRFHEGNNGRPAFSFNLYLSAFDVWTSVLVAADSADVNGEPGLNTVQLFTADSSCTVPVVNGAKFSDNAFTGDSADPINASIQRVQEGFFEIIEMGELLAEDATSASHTNGTPNDCGQLLANWASDDGKWLTDPGINLQASSNTGGIYGSVSILDVAGGIDMTYDATAIEDFSDAILHTPAAAYTPNLSSGNNRMTLVATENKLIKTTWDTSIDAVSSLLMHSSNNNDFVLEANIGALSEWLNVFPTKPFYTDPMFSGTDEILQPFKKAIGEYGGCEPFRLMAHNRDQEFNKQARNIVYPNPLPPNARIRPENCWVVNVARVGFEGTFNGSIFDSALNIFDPDNDQVYSSIVDFPFTEGWMSMRFSEVRFPSLGLQNNTFITGSGENGEVVYLLGKPTLGFVAQKFVNGTLFNGGVLANYAVVNQNKYQRITLIEEP
jgi:surface protein